MGAEAKSLFEDGQKMLKVQPASSEINHEPYQPVTTTGNACASTPGAHSAHKQLASLSYASLLQLQRKGHVLPHSSAAVQGSTSLPYPCTPAPQPGLLCLTVQQIIADGSLRLGGIVGIYPAASVGDDIHVYSSEERTDHVATFHGLRQQAEKDTPEAYMSLSDFIAPREAGVPDYLGLFANACFGLDKLVQPFKDSVSPAHHGLDTS